MSINIGAISDSVKKLIGEEKIDRILSGIYFRASNVLTDEDFETIKILDETDETGQKVQEFMMRKIPNLQSIIQEEVDRSSKSD